MNTDAVIFLREMRKAFGEGMTIEDRQMEQKNKRDARTVYELNSEEVCDMLIQRLKHQWRDWMLAGKTPMEIEVRFTKEHRNGHA